MPKNFVSENNRYLTVETDSIKCIFNKLKGLAVDQFWFKEIDTRPLFGTLPHGYYDDISLGADFYSGHTIIEKPGEHKITDLLMCKYKISYNNESLISIIFETNTRGITLKKKYCINSQTPCLEIKSEIRMPERDIATVYPMNITFIPTSFDQNTLFYATHNGGRELEKFEIGNSTIHHGQSISSLVSAKHGLGATEGVVIIGDSTKQITIWHDQTKSALIPFVHYLPMDDNQYFLRLQFSAQEIDETFKGNNIEQEYDFSWKVMSSYNE